MTLRTYTFLKNFLLLILTEWVVLGSMTECITDSIHGGAFNPIGE